MADRAAAAPAAGRIVVVDDEPDLRAMLGDYLSLHGFAVGGAGDAAALDALLLAEGPPDLLILDVNMPGEDGFALLRRLRAAGCRAGVVMLTAAAVDVPSRVAGLDGGADDYLCKPFAFEELLARVRALVRRPARTTGTTLAVADVTTDLATHRAARAGHRLDLTAKEHALLVYFLRHPDEVLSRTRIYDAVWDERYDGLSNTLEVHVKELRRKLEAHGPRLIHTLRGVGYRFGPALGDES